MPKNNSSLHDIPKTAFFDACRGVFEGGGCRAAAHIGAYDAAIKSGIYFSEVAGTSAGSILAALVGAGATPELLKNTISNLSFSSLLAKPEKYEFESRLWIRIIAHFLRSFLLRKIKLIDGFGKVIIYGGIYSSKPIEKLMDDLLSKLIPSIPGPITFKDLLIPTRIIATDLVAGKAKVWGTEETPNESVSLAVRCSCSIPIYFQPVHVGTNLYVDGGMLSNLPSFVYADADQRPGVSLGGRILAFRLEEEMARNWEWSINSFVERLVTTLVSGATELQIAIKGDVHVVSIPTGTTRATDFNKITSEDISRLSTSGYQAMQDFVKNEDVKIRNSSNNEITCWDKDELFDTVVRSSIEPSKEIYIVEPDTEWFWKLFPSVYRWLANGTKVNVIVKPISISGEKALREKHRRNLLTSLGVEVKEQPDILMSGYFIRREDNNRDVAIVFHNRGTEDAPKATAYIGSIHREIIATVCDQFSGMFSKKTPFKLALRPLNENSIIDLLKRNVGQYSSRDVRIELGELSVFDIELITQYIRAYKYRQIALLVESYKSSSIPLFEVAGVFSGNDMVSTVTPPVVEIHGTHKIAIEGNTRVLYCFRNGIERISCLIVDGVKENLPGKPIDPRRAILSTRHLDPRRRMDEFNYDCFRSIEGAVRPV